MVSAWILASILPAVLWLLVLAVSMHVVADWTLRASPLLSWRPTVLGALAGVCSAARAHAKSV